MLGLNHAGQLELASLWLKKPRARFEPIYEATNSTYIKVSCDSVVRHFRYEYDVLDDGYEFISELKLRTYFVRSSTKKNK